MRRNYIIPFCIILLVTVSGCSSISKEACLLGDWYQIGLFDGQNGLNNKSADYQKDCSEYQVQLDVKLYNEGRSEGLKSFCTYENGVLLGMSKEDYKKVCPAELSSAFLSGYTPYYNLAVAESNQSARRDDISHYASLLEDKSSSKSDRKRYKKGLESAKYNLKLAKQKVKKYEHKIVLHKIQIEKVKIDKELASNDLSDSRTAYLMKRLNALTKKQRAYEGEFQMRDARRSIKIIADWF